MAKRKENEMYINLDSTYRKVVVWKEYVYQILTYNGWIE
jgi:hypothetical protein